MGISYTSNTFLLAALAAAGSFVLLRGGNLFNMVGINGDIMTGLESTINAPVANSLMLLFMNILASRAITEPPARLLKILSYPAVRIGILSLVAYGATQQIEVAISTVVVFLAAMQLLRTPEERARHPMLI